MTTVGGALARCRTALAAAGIESPGLEARLLLSAAFDTTSEQIVAWPTASPATVLAASVLTSATTAIVGAGVDTVASAGRAVLGDAQSGIGGPSAYFADMLFRSERADAMRVIDDYDRVLRKVLIVGAHQRHDPLKSFFTAALALVKSSLPA